MKHAESLDELIRKDTNLSPNRKDRDERTFMNIPFIMLCKVRIHYTIYVIQ